MFLDKHRVLNPNKMDDNKSQGGHTTEATISRDKIDFWHQVWLSSNLNLDIQRYRAQNQIQRVHLDRSKNTTPCHLFAYCKIDNSSSSSSTKWGTTAPFILSILFDYADNNSQTTVGYAALLLFRWLDAKLKEQAMLYIAARVCFQPTQWKNRIVDEM